MRIFNKSDALQDKPCYCWTAEVELQIERELIEKLILNGDIDSNARNEAFNQSEVIDFNIIELNEETIINQ